MNISPQAEFQGIEKNTMAIFSYFLSIHRQSFCHMIRELYQGGAGSLVKQQRYQLRPAYSQTQCVEIFPREAECLLYVFMGLSAKNIAKEMGNSPRTVSNTIARLKNKLGVETRDQLIDLLLDNQFLENF